MTNRRSERRPKKREVYTDNSPSTITAPQRKRQVSRAIDDESNIGKEQIMSSMGNLCITLEHTQYIRICLCIFGIEKRAHGAQKRPRRTFKATKSGAKQSRLHVTAFSEPVRFSIFLAGA